MAPNIPELYELHFGVPMAGAVLCALNTKLNAATLSLKLEQLEAKVIFVDHQFIEVVETALGKLKSPNLITLISMQEIMNNTGKLSEIKFDYKTILAMGKTDFRTIYPKDERDPISINYTSGSTGNPKGAIYSHRAVYLNSLAQIFRTRMRSEITPVVFLWTVDMFRCNGWCFPWAMAALGGTNICIRDVTGKSILDNIFTHNVTHFCGQPKLLTMIADLIPSPPRLPRDVEVIVAGVMPYSDQIRIKLEEIGFKIYAGYGMSEVLGPVTTVPWEQHQLYSNSDSEQRVIKLREGIHNLMVEGIDVKDPATMESVPSDGKTIGEVMFRSNAVMLGYLKNSRGSEEAFRGGWYRTGDLGVKNPDGTVELKDRGADVIVCGGEIVSSLEVEALLVSHPTVEEAAVVGRSDDVLGEIPCAFVKLKEEEEEEEGLVINHSRNYYEEIIIEFCGKYLPDYMVPKSVFFGELPVNSTGKIQKFVLRERLKMMDIAKISQI